MKILYIAFMAIIAASTIHTPTASACSLNPTAVISAPTGPYLSDNTSTQWKSIGSTANCGSITSYKWKLDDVVLSSSANFSYTVALGTNQLDSTFTLKLVITNTAGRKDSTMRTVTVRDYQGQYYVKDHLGSPRVTVDGKGNVLSYADYYPFGGIMPGRSGNNGMSHDRTKFTGYLLEEEGEQDTYHAEARGYDPVIGRFTSRDPLEKLYPGVTPFAYAMNNPVRLVDPTGMSPWVFDDSDSGDKKFSSSLPKLNKSNFNHHAPFDKGESRSFEIDGKMEVGRDFTPLSGSSDPPNATNNLQVMDPVEGTVETIFAIIFGRTFDGYTVSLDGKICCISSSVGDNIGSFLIGGGAKTGSKLFRAALMGHKATRHTQVGRALTKHPGVAGFNSFDDMMNTLKTPAAVNQAASAALKNIMRNGTRTVEHAPTLGTNVIQYRLPNGFGARWNMEGGFVGFINP